MADLVVRFHSIDGLGGAGNVSLLYQKSPTEARRFKSWRTFEPSGAKLGEIALPHPVEGISLSKDGQTLAVAACALHVLDIGIENGVVRFSRRFSALDQQSGGGVSTMREQFRQVAVSSNGDIVAGAAGSPGPLAAEAGHVALFALRDGRRIARLQTPRLAARDGHVGDYDIGAVAFSPDGEFLAAGGEERIVTIWMAPPVR